MASSSICHKIQGKRGLGWKRGLNILEKENFPSVKEKGENEGDEPQDGINEGK